MGKHIDRDKQHDEPAPDPAASISQELAQEHAALANGPPPEKPIEPLPPPNIPGHIGTMLDRIDETLKSRPDPFAGLPEPEPAQPTDEERLKARELEAGEAERAKTFETQTRFGEAGEPAPIVSDSPRPKSVDEVLREKIHAKLVELCDEDPVTYGYVSAYAEVFNAIRLFWSDPNMLLMRLRDHAGWIAGALERPGHLPAEEDEVGERAEA